MTYQVKIQEHLQTWW